MSAARPLYLLVRFTIASRWRGEEPLSRTATPLQRLPCSGAQPPVPGEASSAHQVEPTRVVFVGASSADSGTDSVTPSHLHRTPCAASLPPPSFPHSTLHLVEFPLFCTQQSRLTRHSTSSQPTTTIGLEHSASTATHGVPQSGPAPRRRS